MAKRKTSRRTKTHPYRIGAQPPVLGIRWFVTISVAVMLMPSALSISLSSSSNDIVQPINGSSIWGTCLELEQIGTNYLGFRYTGGPGASAAADWISTKFQEIGLSTTEEKFRSRTWLLDSQPSMKVVLENGSSIEVGSFVCEFWTIGTGPEEVEAPLVVLPCPEVSEPQDYQTVELNESEWNAKNTSGCIVLTGMSALMNGRWSDVLVEKLANQKPRLVIYTEWHTFLSTFRPEFNALLGNRTWGSDPAFGNLPVAYVSYEDSLWLRELRDGTKTRVRIQTHIEDAEHRNILGMLQSPKSAGQKVIVCAHYDSALTPGFVDDGTGVSAMLEIAHTLTDAVRNGSWVPDFDLLFIGFDAEEAVVWAL